MDGSFFGGTRRSKRFSGILDLEFDLVIEDDGKEVDVAGSIELDVVENARREGGSCD